MPAGRPPSYTHGEFVDAAIRLADEAGLNTLTMKSLGDAVGASTTAVYRYFTDKDELVAAMRDALLTPLLPAIDAAGPAPHDRLLAAAQAFRGAVRIHPCLGQVMALPARDLGSSALIPGVLLNELERLGLSGTLLVRGYQQLESFVVGSTIFDYSDAPRHLADRRERFRNVAHPTLREELATDAAVEANNEAAFSTTLRLILDALVFEQSRNS